MINNYTVKVILTDHLNRVMVSVLVSSGMDHGFNSRSSQTKGKLGKCDILTCGLSIQRATSTIKI